MDPDVTWILLLAALETENGRAVREHAQDLLDWLHLGGFPPTVSHPVMDRFWNRQIALYACKMARVIARRRLRG